MLRSLRKLHLYVGLFIAPALLFFAFTGVVQTLSLHEAAGSGYKPPAWLASLGQVHKKQTLTIPPRRPGSPPSGDPGAGKHGSSSPTAAPNASSSPPPPITLSSKQRQHLPLKVFFVLVGLGLFLSTLTGIYMAYKYERGRLLVTALLLLGVVVPLLLLRF